MLTKKHVEGTDQVPAWLVVMYNTIFSGSCSYHANGNAKSSKMDRFCIDCAKPLCSICLLHPNHHNHNHLKIRRYIYNDVIKKQDFSKIFSCHGIQTYQTNKAKVIFLKQRNKQQMQEDLRKGYRCIICDKSLQDSLYCSIGCKVAHIYRNQANKETGDVADCSLMWRNKRRQGRRKGFPLRAPMF